MKAAMKSDLMSDQSGLAAPLYYLSSENARPVSHVYFNPPNGTPLGPKRSPQQVTIRNGRELQPGASLEREGFQLLDHRSVVSDWLDPKQVAATYYCEVGRLLQDITGADLVVISNHTIRNSESAAIAEQPTTKVYNFFTPRSAEERARDLLGVEQEWRLRRHFAAFFVWRPLGQGPLRHPLTVCDATSVAPSDLVPNELKFPDGTTGENYLVTYSPDHRWYFFPQMTEDEVLLMKVFDSAVDGRARFTPCSSFYVPDIAADVGGSKAIEVQAFAFF